jgi:hypothetical protein
MDSPRDAAKKTQPLTPEPYPGYLELACPHCKAFSYWRVEAAPEDLDSRGQFQTLVIRGEPTT